MLNIQGGMNLKQNNRFIMAMYRLGHLNYQELVPQLSKTETIIFHCMIESDDGCVVDPKKDTNYGRIKMSVLAKKIDISTQSLSRMIKGLEEKGYLKREVDESDRRNTYVLFTEKGKTLSEEMHDKYKKLFHSVNKHIGEEKLIELGMRMDELVDVIEDELKKQINENKK